MSEVKITEVKITEQIPQLENVTSADIRDQIDVAKERISKLKDVAEEDNSSEDQEEKPMETQDNEGDGEETEGEKPEDKPVSSDECPACHCRKRKKTGGFPFGRDPADANAQPKKPKEEPKTPWGKFQREYADKFKDLNSSQVTTALARVYYVPVHTNGTKTPKSLERMLRETHHFIQPWAKNLTEEEKAKSLRQWVEGLLHAAIVNHHISTHSRPPGPENE